MASQAEELNIDRSINNEILSKPETEAVGIIGGEEAVMGSDDDSIQIYNDQLD